MALTVDMTGRLFSKTFIVASVFTTGDAKETWIAPCDSILVYANAHIKTVGGTGGYTWIQLCNTTDHVNMFNGDGLAIAYNDADGAAEGTLSTTQSSLTVGDGDVINLDIDSCCSGAAEKDLVVETIWRAM